MKAAFKVWIRFVDFVVKETPIVISIAGVVAYFYPESFGWVRGDTQTLVLGLIMLTMGLTLTTDDFRILAHRPFDLALGATAQFLIMPLIAYLLAKSFGLSEGIAVGLILVGCSPGGVSSNLMSFLCKGDVAYSVGMTTVSTLLAPVLTPMLMLYLAGTRVDVDAIGMFKSIVFVTILPIVVGLFTNRMWGENPRYKKVKSGLPLIAVLSLAAIVGGVVSAQGAAIAKSGIVIFIAVLVHNGLGYTFGYLAATAFRFSTPKRRTLSIEVGMQNAGLATVLATRHFPLLPEAAIASAVSCVWHSVSGAVMARAFIFFARKPKAMVLLVMIALSVVANCSEVSPAWEPDGVPYEISRAGRTHDDFVPIVPFTDASGWRVECQNAVAFLDKCEAHRLFGPGSLKLTYRSVVPAGVKTRPIVKILPDHPIELPKDADAISIWCYGNNNYGKDAKGINNTPMTTLFAEFADGKGGECECMLEFVNHREWFLSFRRIPAPILAKARAGGMKLAGFQLRGGTNVEDRELMLTSFCAFKDDLDTPLGFKPRAKRGVQVFADAPQGVNIGEGRLPFPNSPRTILPPEEPEDPRLEFRFPQEPSKSWDDLAFRWKGGKWVSFALGGGVYPETARKDAKVTFRRVGNSVVADVTVRGGKAEDVRFGTVDAPTNSAVVGIPFLSFRKKITERPMTLTFKQGDDPLFISAHADWTQSAASEPYPAKQGAAAAWAMMGGMKYNPRTDGKRNDVYERLVWTVSPRFESTLPSIPNPQSPWKKITGRGVWAPYGASKDREVDAKYWRRMKLLGLDHVIVNDHETMWRDGNESFTFRTDPAPAKGGDEAQRKYTRVMIDELGYRYGPYNNFTDFAPVNAHWNRDWVARLSDGQPQTGWYRCYGPKPISAVEACAVIAPAIQRKFGFNTAYCDVHTAITPWSRCDYDARLPGAGTFAQTFYCYGEIMLLQRAAWNGPVYSEGGTHWLYCGLTDGNYAQDYAYRFAENPWLVDFDLLRMHPLCCNFGMGMPQMFYDEKKYPTDRWELADLFLTATAAFGHSGYFMREQGLSVHSYAMIQAVAARYTQADAVEIRYGDEKSKLHDTSSAVSMGVYRLNRVAVRYSDGTTVAANGGKRGSGDFVYETEYGRIKLPPAGFLAIAGDGEAATVSGVVGSNRVDVVISEEYEYVNGRGSLVRTAIGATDGLLYRRKLSPLEEKVVCRDAAANVELPYVAESIESFNCDGKSRGKVKFEIVGETTVLKSEFADGHYIVKLQKAQSPTTVKSAIMPFVEAK